MFSLKSIVLIAAVFVGAKSSAVVPAVPAAPLIAQAQVGYAHAVPQNIAPYASQISVVNRAINPIVATPLAAPVAAPVAARYAPAPYFAAPSPYLPATYAAAPYAYPASFAAPAAYAAPFPYGAPAPLVRAPYGFGPAFVR
ncbi:unnamed protein product [Euphydryas editha]|uniref:Uncharacterized protein n=1 Tax=Euphydryas editha TaxID=104508 RepID=A0AAU9TVQ7_EUPED|nr:unnamed protein product [Euphydryas editha]